jgi:dTDP-4-dehydrorhamnose 3,5-epimerase
LLSPSPRSASAIDPGARQLTVLTMRFTETRVRGAFAIDLERRTDERGFFARAWCRKEFQEQGLTAQMAQVNVSSNAEKGTLRGLHFQLPPFQEAKTVCCTRGALYDVVVDLRPDSPSFLRWAAVELTAGNRCMLFIPEGCAHGFQTLATDTEVLYLMSEFYTPAYARGVRYNDPAFGIDWPLPATSLSEADLTWPDYEPTALSAAVGEADA